MSRTIVYSMQVSGAGTPFFPPLDQPLRLELIDTRRFESGVVYLRHRVLRS